jgi:hypothetical protein
MKKSILILSLALMAISAFAQHDEQVTVEGKYRPKVNKVNKLQLKPEIPQPSYAFPSTEVNPKEAKQKFALDLEKIAPTAFAAKDDKLVSPTQNFLMAGIGTRLSPLFFYKHNSMLTKTLGLNVGVKHNSSWLNIKDYAPSSYMNNAFDVGLSYEDMGQYRLETGAFFNNDMYHYYGVNLVDIPLNEAQIEAFCPRQVYNTIGAFVNLSAKGYPLGVPVGPGSIKYHYTYDRFGCSDGLVEFDYSYVYYVNWFGKKQYPQRLKVDVDLDFNHYKCNDSLINRGFGRVNPSFEMSGDFYRIQLGASVDGYAAQNDRKVAVRPDVSGSLFVLDKKLEFYAGLNGGLRMLTYSDFIAENPFVWQLQDFRVKNVKLGFEGGVRTNIAEIVDLHLGVRYRNTDNDPLFKTDDYNIDYSHAVIPFNKFTVVYDEIQTVSVLADMRVKLRNSLTADLGFAYNNNTPTVEEYAWYRPEMEGKLKLTYDLNEKLAFNTTFLYQGGRYAQVPEFGNQGLTYSTQKLKDVFDLSLGADYKVNDQITAFALLDNVANQKYKLFYDYPVTGIQFYAGVKLRF